jgi:hypothetical protein
LGIRKVAPFADAYEILHRRIEHLHEAYSSARAELLKICKNPQEVSSAPRFQTTSSIPSLQQAVAKLFPNNSGSPIRRVIIKALTKRLKQSGVLFSLQHLTQQLFR